MCQSPIANIDINKEYDESLGTEEVHYQSFSRMAAFFGRDMQAHRHDRYFQMHYLDTGQIELQLPGREHTLALLAQAVFTLLLRNARLDDHAASGMRGELKLFQRFNQMIDSHFHQHWTVPDYARELHLTESRLTDICRRFANRSPKRLIFDRQLREAKRLLLFSDSAVNEIAWQLGFKDPAQQLPGAKSTCVVIPGGAALAWAIDRRAGQRRASR